MYAALAFIPENWLLPLHFAVTFAQIPSIAVHCLSETRDVHRNLHNNKRVLSPFRRDDEDWKDAVGQHSREFMAHFVYCRQNSQNFPDLPLQKTRARTLKMVADLKAKGLWK